MAQDTFTSFEKFSADWLYKDLAFDKPKYGYYTHNKTISFVEMFGRPYGDKRKYYIKDTGMQIDFKTGNVSIVQFNGYPISLNYGHDYDTIEEMHRDLIDNAFEGFI